MIEVTTESPQRPDVRLAGLWGDRHYDGLRTTDGVDISSRKKHREYMKLTGLTTADDYSSSWAKAKEQRENYYKRGGTITRNDILRIIHQLENK